MNIAIAQIVKLIVDYIKSWFATKKLQDLKTNLELKKEITNESLKEASTDFNKFMSHYDAWLDDEERRLAVQRATERVRSVSEKTAADVSRLSSRAQGKRSSNRRAAASIKRSTKKR